MGQVLAVFWEKVVLLSETRTAKERARVHTMQRRGCCMKAVRNGESVRRRQYVAGLLEVNATRGTEKRR